MKVCIRYRLWVVKYKVSRRTAAHIELQRRKQQWIKILFAGLIHHRPRLIEEGIRGVLDIPGSSPRGISVLFRGTLSKQVQLKAPRCTKHNISLSTVHQYAAADWWPAVPRCGIALILTSARGCVLNGLII